MQKQLLATLAVLLTVVGPETGVSVPQSGTTQMTDQQAIRLVFLVVADEAEANRSGSALSAIPNRLKILIGALRVGTVTEIDRDTVQIADTYIVRITRSDDRRHCQVSLTPIARGCAPAWFSSETQVVFSGRSVQCNK